MKKLEKVDAKLKVKLEKKAQKDQLSSAAAEKGEPGIIVTIPRGVGSHGYSSPLVVCLFVCL